MIHFIFAALTFAAGQSRPPASLAGTVRDSVSGAPVEGATIRLRSAGQDASTRSAERTGDFVFRELPPGQYELVVSHIGFRPTILQVHVADGAETLRLDIQLAPVVTRIGATTIVAGPPVSIDMGTGDQAFKSDAYHGAPTTTTSQIIQQAVAGAARAPAGEVHIRGQHAEYTYYIDGVPVPAGVSGSLNELFDPAIIDRISFQTGGWDAEFGNRNIAVVQLSTKIPEGRRTELSTYQGSFNSSGQTLVLSNGRTGLGTLLSLTRTETSMRREPLQAAADGSPVNFHNAGQDQYGFGKLEFSPTHFDAFEISVGASRTRAAIPFNPTFAVLDDYQTDVNAFANLGWRHRFGEANAVGADRQATQHGPELFLAAFIRRSTLNYVPGEVDEPSFVFFPDTTKRFNVRESRAATTAGLKSDFTVALRPTLTWKNGIETSIVYGREQFSTRDARGDGGPFVNTSVRGGDVGAYTQLVWSPVAHWQLKTGFRLDHHVAPIAGDQHQVSPRVRLNWTPNPDVLAWIYAGRLFIPANVEDFHVLAGASNGGTTGLPTFPERDDYFEAGLVRRFGAGITAKIVGYRRNNTPGVDDNTLPGTALVATVNVARVRVSGVEAVLELHDTGPLSGYVNAALSHASAHGPGTGGFFPTPYPSGWFDQDHDQRLSIVAGGNYVLSQGYLNLTGIFGTGLTSGLPDAAENKTGLFDFNPRVKVAPSFVLNAGAGSGWQMRGFNVRVELSAENVLDRRYILKGAFTSGPSVGRPRSLTVRMVIAHRDVRPDF